MTDNSRNVLEFLQPRAKIADFTAKQIADELGISSRSANATITFGLVKKGLAYREEGEKNGEKVKFIKLTEEGYTFDPDSDEE